MAPRNLKIMEESNEGKEEMDSGDKSNNNKKTSPVGAIKVCGVCGDKAFGYNFNAVTCESCKAFFRRNALASKEFRCPFSEQCEITVLTRRFCQKCRLEKCLSIGMAKEYIMSDEDKAQKRLKIAENKAKKRQSSKFGDDEVSSSKLIKREDNDDSNTSWTQNGKQSSPVSCEEQHSIESSDNMTFDNKQAVSVIRNNNNSFSENHIIEATSDNNHLNQFSPLLKKTEYSVNYNTYNDTNIVMNSPSNSGANTNNNIMKYPNALVHASNGVHQNGSLLPDSLVNNMRFAEREDENFMIRSMLTTPTPNNNSESSTVLPVINNREPISQPLCDSALLGSHHEKPNKVDVARDVLQDVER